MLEIDIIQGAQLTQTRAESVRIRVSGEGEAKILPGHMPFIALCEGGTDKKESLFIDDREVPIVNPFLIETKHDKDHTYVTIFAPEIPGIPPPKKEKETTAR